MVILRRHRVDRHRALVISGYVQPGKALMVLLVLLTIDKR
jgi:hypothetical protein